MSKQPHTTQNDQAGHTTQNEQPENGKKSKGKTNGNSKEDKKSKKVTKKAIVERMVQRKSGATPAQMAKEMQKAGLGDDLALHERTAKLWLYKLDFIVEKDKETGKYKKK